MGIGDMFEKLDDIVYEPVKLISDWLREPLKKREHERQEAYLDHELKREIERKTAEKRIDSEIQLKEQAHQAQLKIQQETEIMRIITEIEEWKKDQEFQRMKAVSEAIMKFQQELTKLNIEAINAIGTMQLDLRNKAQNVIHEKTLQYKKMQDVAIKDAMRDLKKIETEFPDNEAARTILNKAVDARLSNIITAAHQFLTALNDDLKSVNSSISLLAESGQRFIERHIEQFRALGLSEREIKQLEEVNTEVIDVK